MGPIQTLIENILLGYSDFDHIRRFCFACRSQTAHLRGLKKEIQ